MGLYMGNSEKDAELKHSPVGTPENDTCFLEILLSTLSYMRRPYGGRRLGMRFWGPVEFPGIAFAGGCRSIDAHVSEGGRCLGSLLPRLGPILRWIIELLKIPA